MKNEGQLFMGIDVGTFETKGVVINGEGKIVAQAAVGHGTENPKPGFYEHDAEAVWWHDVCAVSRMLLEQPGVSADQIAAVGASTLGSDCLPVDEHCKPLRKAILYGIDARSTQEIAFLTDHYGEAKVKELFGRPLNSSDVATKILWIKNNEPEIYQKTHKFLTGSSFVVARLTGNYVIDQFLAKASFKPLYNTDGSIAEDRCELFCRPDQLARAQVVTDIAGYVTEAAAAQTGLRAGTPVTTGTGDSTAEAISTGILGPGDMMIQFGSSLFFYCCTDHLVLDDRLWGNNFTIPGAYSISAGTNSAGTLTRWYRDVVFPDLLAAQEAGGANAYDAMMAGLEDIPPGSDGLITLPYWAGERTPINDPHAKGMLFGLGLNHTRQHLYRSALEAVGFSIGQHIDILRERNVLPTRIMAVGGGTKTPVWMQIVADIIGMPLHINKITIGACYGDALMAAIGAGHFAGFANLRHVVEQRETVTPNMKNHEAYRKYRNLFDELYTANKHLMHRL